MKDIYLEIFGQSLYVWKNWNDTLGIFYCMPLCQIELEWSWLKYLCEFFLYLNILAAHPQWIEITCIKTSLYENLFIKVVGLQSWSAKKWSFCSSSTEWHNRAGRKTAGLESPLQVEEWKQQLSERNKSQDQVLQINQIKRKKQKVPVEHRRMLGSIKVKRSS